MTDTSWVVCPLPVDDAEAVQRELGEIHGGVYEKWFADDLAVNHDLPVQTRAFRRNENWAVCLLLTPWMLARILLAKEASDLPAVPEAWSASARIGAEPSVLGPIIEFKIGNAPQRAHLNYHPRLGHYLIQPLIQNLSSYESADEVFAAWREVIERRDRFVEEQGMDCQWQKEISRREFFDRFRRKAG